MINLILPKKIEERIIEELRAAGNREIGGILMGEHLEENTFKISDFTIQRKGGTFAFFVRKIQRSLLRSLQQFFTQTRHEYTRFNYLGEWHSHPSFFLIPSPDDQETMWEIVDDSEVGANFAFLLLVKLKQGHFEGKTNLFYPGFPMMEGQLIREELEGYE